MLRIGLTGPTGSGKSTVTALMRQWGGVEVLDADAIAHEVNNSPAAAAAIAKAFAEKEFEKFRVLQDRTYQSDFDRLVAETSDDLTE